MTLSSDRAANPSKRHLTTRRGFLVAGSLGTISLYGGWAWLGAAPLGIGGHDDHADGDAGPVQAGGHGDHGKPSGPSVDEFRRLTDDFIARYRLPDGSVQPHRMGAAAPPLPLAPAASAHDAHTGHGAPVQDQGHGAHAGHGSAPTHIETPDGPVEVYLAAAQWAFEPAVLRLEAGVAYRFRMMAVDASHGAALQLGAAGHVIRLRRGALVEHDLTFARAGEYLLYCTLFCGVGHDRMAGRIIVT